MKPVVVHAGLLAAVLLLAFLTWTGDARTEPADEASVVVWQHDPDDIAGVTFRSDDRVVDVDRRGAGADTHLWARETISITLPDSDTAETLAAQSRIEEYPVGDAGVTLLEDLARLRAVRDLGEATEDKRAMYGLSEPGAEITVRMRRGAEGKLALGSNVVGGGDRYAQEVERNRIFVLPSGLLRALESRDMLRLTQVQPFVADDIGSAAVRAAGAERVMRRRTTGSPPRAIWSASDSERADEGFANFMEQLDRLWVSRYVSDLSEDTLQTLVRVDYFDGRGRTLGFLELQRTGGEEPTYFMRTARTIVFGEVYAPQAERIEQDIATLFRSNREP
jgi:hypothetical protein